MAFPGQLEGLGKGDILGDAADPSGVFRQVNGPDNGGPVQDHLVSGGFLGLDDGGDGGFQELKNIGAVVREEIVQLDRLLHRCVQDGFAQVDGILA